MSIFGFQPSFLNVDSHFKTQVGHGAITLVVGLAGDIFGLWWGRGLVTLALLFYVGREVGAHRFYREHRAAMSEQEYRKARWDSKLDVAWPVVAAAVVWTIPWAGELWPWWVGSVAVLLAVGKMTDPGGQYSGME